MRVLLDGSTYELDGGVQREAIPEWPQFQPDIGKRRREDRAYISSYAKESWGGGFGILKSLPEVDLDRFWDADAETRFPGQITPPILAVQDTITPLLNLGQMLNFSDKVFAITAGSLNQHYIYNYNSSSGWGSYSSIGSYGRGLMLGSIKKYSKLYSLVWGPDPSGTTGIHWAIWSGVGSTTGTMNIGYADVNVPVSSFPVNCSDKPVVITTSTGNTFYGESSVMVCYDPDDVNTYLRGKGVLKTSGASYRNVGASLSLVAIGDGKLFVNNSTSRDANFVFNVGPSIDYDGKGLISWNRTLFIPSSKDILAYQEDETVTPIGADDGFSDEISGPFTASAISLQYLLLGKSGDISTRKAIIVLYDGIGWHSIWKDSAYQRFIYNMEVSQLSNEMPRLHFFVSPTLGFNGATLAYHLPFLSSNPITEGSLTVATQGYFTDSQFQGYTPELPGGFYRVSIQGEALGTPHIITVCYGINGAAPVITLGQVSSSGQWLNFGTVGTQGNYIQMKYILERGTLAGTYPQFKMAVMEYMKNPPLRESWLFTINNNKTAKELQLSEEQVLSNIRTSQQKNTMIPFNYGAMGTRNVRVESALAQESVIENMPSFEAERKSLIQVRLVEIF